MLPTEMDRSNSFGGSYRLYMDDIVGDRGAIYIGPDQDQKVSMTLSEHVGSERQTITRPHWGLWFGGTDADDDPAFAMFSAFFDSIRTGQLETRNSGTEARRTLAVIQAAIESSTTGQSVSLLGRSF